MKKVVLHVVLAGLLTTLTACMGPDSPQEVTQEFWQAVVEKQTDDAVEYSTLTDPRYYDSFSKSWQGYQFSMGKVVIDKNQASIATKLTAPPNSGLQNRSFTTYMIKQQGEWKVDYERTKHSIHGGSIGGLFNALSKLGKDINSSLETTVGKLSNEVQAMLNELEELSRSFGEKASKSLEQHAEKMRKYIKELEDSINRALEEEQEHLSDQDKNTLQVMAKELNEDRQQLSDHSMESVVRSSQHIVEAHVKLEANSNEALKKYKEEWKVLSQQFEEELRQMMNELSSNK
jgi:ElaB/YqjD/DUF883 family membrane-anchored ribosome-binding protein